MKKNLIKNPIKNSEKYTKGKMKKNKGKTITKGKMK
jgi:hypothetical protein